MAQKEGGEKSGANVDKTGRLTCRDVLVLAYHEYGPAGMIQPTSPD